MAPNCTSYYVTGSETRGSYNHNITVAVPAPDPDLPALTQVKLHMVKTTLRETLTICTRVAILLLVIVTLAMMYHSYPDMPVHKPQIADACKYFDFDLRHNTVVVYP